MRLFFAKGFFLFMKTAGLAASSVAEIRFVCVTILCSAGYRRLTNALPIIQAMRLLNTRTGEFQWIENPEDTTYAILSHTWSPNGEQTYAELLAIQADVRSARESSARSGFPPLPENEVLLRACPKIRYACAYALSQGMERLWIDSGCIDKTNSAELSEAINSTLR